MTTRIKFPFSMSLGFYELAEYLSPQYCVAVDSRSTSYSAEGAPFSSDSPYNLQMSKTKQPKSQECSSSLPTGPGVGVIGGKIQGSQKEARKDLDTRVESGYRAMRDFVAFLIVDMKRYITREPQDDSSDG